MSTDTVDNSPRFVNDPFDLQSLANHEPVFDEVRNRQVLVTPTNVEQFAETVFEAAKADSSRPLVIALGFGGTISMKEDEHGRRVPDLNVEEIVRLTDPRIKDRYQLFGIDLIKTDSSQLQIDDAADAVITMSYLWRHMPRELKENFAGFLVAHGTDSMSKDAAHILTMLGPEMPFGVVFTGSQEPINSFVNDASENVKHSLVALETMMSERRADGLVVAGGIALIGSGIEKIDDHHARAFGSPIHKDVLDFGFNPDPRISHDKSILPSWLRNKPGIASRFTPTPYRGVNNVGEIQAEMSEDPAYLEAAIGARKAVLIRPYGTSTYDMVQAQRVGDIAEELGIPRFAISPVSGQIDTEAYESGQAIARAARAEPIFMTPDAARAKLVLAQGLANLQGEPYATFSSQFMPENYIGEIPDLASVRIKNTQ